MSHIFISYARKDKEFVDQIAEALKSKGLDIWIDDRIPKGEDWENDIYKNIDKSEAFLFMLSKNSAISEMCNKEIARAKEKRIIPIFIGNVNDDEVDEDENKVENVIKAFLHNDQMEIIKRRNFIFCRKGRDDFDKAVKTIIETIQTDYGWLNFHTDLQNKALEWEKKKDNNLLLRGKMLADAVEKLISAGSQKDPQPTDLQRHYIEKSRQAEKNRRRRNIATSIGVTLTICLLCGIAIFMRNIATQNANGRATAQAERNAEATRAEEQSISRATAQANAAEKAKLARARELAEKVNELRESDPALSLLLSVEAFRMADNDQTRGVLFDSAMAYPHLKQFLSGIGSGGMAFSPDGNTFARGYGGSIILYDTNSWLRTRSLAYPTENVSVNKLAFSPDGKKFASGGNDGAVLLWDVASGQPTQVLAEHTRWQDNLQIENLVFDSRGQFLVSSRNDGTVNVWNVGSDSPKMIFNRKFQCGTVFEQGSGEKYKFDHGIAISPNSKILAICDNENYFSLWNISTGKLISKPNTTPPGHMSGIVFSPDGQSLITFGDKNNIVFWDGSTGREIRTLAGSGNGVYSLALGPDGNTLAYGSKDTGIIMWDIASDQLINTLILSDKFTSAAYDLTFSPDGNTLVSRYGGLITIWDLMGRQSLVKTFVGHDAPVKNVDFVNNNQKLVSISEDGVAITWDVNTGEILSTQSGQATYDTFGTGLHGNILVTQRSTGKVELWDENDELIGGQPLIGHTGYINTIIFSPDEKMLATASDDKTIKLWDIYNARLILTLKGHTGRVFGLAFSSDGKKLASTSDDGTVRVWNIDPWSWTEEVCLRAGRNLEMPEDTSNFNPSDFENYVPNDEWSEYFPGEDYHITCPQWPPGN